MFVPFEDEDSARAYLARLFSGSRSTRMTRVVNGETFDMEIVVPHPFSFGGLDPIARYAGKKPQVIWTASFPDRAHGHLVRHRIRISGPSVAVIGSIDRVTRKETVHRVLICVSAEERAEASFSARRVALAS